MIYDNIIYIPARSGSKRIKHKNIKLIDGKPLFYYQIENAFNVGGNNLIVFSSDSSEYFDLVKKYFDNILFYQRSSSTSNDSTKIEDGALECINYLENKGNSFKNIILLQITSPLNRYSYVNQGLDQMKKEQTLSVVSYTEDTSFELESVDIISRPNSQDKKPRIKETGCFWITDINKFKENQNRIVEPYSVIKVPYEASLEIDNIIELKVIERIIEENNHEKDKKYYHSRVNTVADDCYDNTVDPDGIKRDMLSPSERDKKIERCKVEINFINNLPKKNSKLKFLDLGCGPGHIAPAIDSKKFIKYGLDTVESACKLAEPYYDHIICGELESDTFDEEMFDVILCYHTIEHVADPIPFIKNVSKILKTHGHLVIGTPDFDSAAARHFKENFRLLNDPTHISLFSSDGLSKLLTHNNFTINKKDYPFFDEDHFNKENLMRLFDSSKPSPPFYGSIQTFYCVKN
tara:strand:+ start:499 stop:1887 length:1389 start_codon:yes stop_codon:yes gene_type:complete